MKTSAAIREYLIEIEVRKYTPKTIRGYRNSLNLFLRAGGAHPRGRGNQFGCGAAIQRVYEPEGKGRQLHQRPLESIEVVYPVLL